MILLLERKALRWDALELKFHVINLITVIFKNFNLSKFTHVKLILTANCVTAVVSLIYQNIPL